MALNTEHTFMLFYSNFSQTSLTTRAMIAEMIQQHFSELRINFKEVDCDIDYHLKKQYHVSGIPTLLTLAGDEVTGRYLGEITKDGILAIMQSMLEN